MCGRDVERSKAVSVWQLRVAFSLNRARFVNACPARRRSSGKVRLRGELARPLVEGTSTIPSDLVPGREAVKRHFTRPARFLEMRKIVRHNFTGCQDARRARLGQ